MGCCASKTITLNVTDEDVARDANQGAFKSVVDNKGATFTAQLVNEHKDGTTLEDKYDTSKEVLGRGGFGVVISGTHRDTGMTYAIKSMPVDQISKAELDELQLEVDVLRRLDHPNIVRVFETFWHLQVEEKVVHIVMENLSGGNLKKRLHENGKAFPEARVVGWMRSMFSAIHYCHSHSVCHRDIKLENFVLEGLEENAELKLIDFGLAAVVNKGDEEMEHLVGTYAFMAPEMLKDLGRSYYDSACDLWSMGVCTYELLAGPMMRPYLGTDKKSPKSPQEQWSRIKKNPLVIPATHDGGMYSDNCKDFIHKILCIEPKGRIGAGQALKHPWLAPSDGEGVQEGQADALKAFAKTGTIERLALDSVAFTMDPKHARELRETFKRLDVDGTGTLSIEELQSAFEAFGGLSQQQVREIFQAIDTSHTGEINYTEFIAAMLMSKPNIQNEDDMKAAFEALDVDGSGSISKEELKRVLGNTELTEQEVFAAAGTDGLIDFEEFKVILKGTT